MAAELVGDEVRDDGHSFTPENSCNNQVLGNSIMLLTLSRRNKDDFLCNIEKHCII